MKVKFRLYNGLAGDPHLLLIGEDTNGKMISYLWDRTSWFKNWNLKKLKKKILKQFELESIIPHEEDLSESR
jgi:hypothetical protein